MSIGHWIGVAHSEQIEICHCTTNQQCAGLAIFRANICKLPYLGSLILEQNKKIVFANDAEFSKHHTV